MERGEGRTLILSTPHPITLACSPEWLRTQHPEDDLRADYPSTP